MLDTIGGIPLHPLIVHAVVVLVPLAALMLLVAAVSQRFRHWAGILTPITATVALALVPFATQSGEALEKRVEASPALEEHTELGDSLIYFVLALTVLAWALWFLDRRARAAATTADAADGAPARVGRSGLMTAVIVLSVISVLATTVQVVRIGHSGASASWSDVGAKPVPAGGGDGDD